MKFVIERVQKAWREIIKRKKLQGCYIFFVNIQYWKEKVVFPLEKTTKTNDTWLFALQLVKPWLNGLASRCKSTQVRKTRTCVRTCDGRSHGFTGRLASSRKSHIQFICNQLAFGGQTVKNLRRLAYEFELDQSQRKSTQVDGQPKHKLNASRKRASTCEAWALSGS